MLFMRCELKALVYNGGAMRAVLLAGTIKIHRTIRKTDV